jgi:hypothetical protein
MSFQVLSIQPELFFRVCSEATGFELKRLFSAS